MLTIVPMFHANAWGLPYAAFLCGASLLMPERYLQAEPLVKMVKELRPTVSGAIPTIWADIYRYGEANEIDLSSFRAIVCGGSGGAAFAHGELRAALRRAHHPGVGHDRDVAARARCAPARRRGAGQC